MMKIMKKVLLWVAVVFLGVIALASLPHFSAVLGLLTIALLMPIEQWQTLIKKWIKGKLKPILALVLAVATLCTFPMTESSETEETPVSGSTTTVSTAFTEAENTTASVTEDVTSTTKKITTQKVTTTKGATITKTPTITTTRIITTTKTTTTKKITTTEQKTKYVLNTDSKKFHYITCRKLPTKNREDVTMSREEIINMGYSPCGICKP
ncbi:MAG: hypothetical protein IJN04_00140 [Clostridia bacterium]|nr:hypothetical protein [Clostridia bacterium]MBQ7088041.1 hypothetical protein [Clostridia bacterium]